MLAQQLNEVDSRVPHLAATSTYSNLILPDPVADKLIGWNSGGTGLQNITAADVSLTTVSAYMATVLDDASATAARTTLAAAALASNTFTGIQTLSSTQARWAKGGDLTSADPLVIDTDGNYFDVTGTTGFTSMTVTAGTLFMLQFDGALTLTHHATNLELPGEANIVTAAGDTMLCFATGTDTVQVLAYTQAGARNYQDRILQRPVLKDYGELTNAIGSTGGGTQDIDLTLGNVVSLTVDTSANTFTFSNPTASDEGCSFTMIAKNGGSQTVNWPASVDWAGGTAPTLTTSGTDILTFLTIDGGTIWHGFAATLDSK